MADSPEPALDTTAPLEQDVNISMTEEAATTAEGFQPTISPELRRTLNGFVVCVCVLQSSISLISNRPLFCFTAESELIADSPLLSTGESRPGSSEDRGQSSMNVPVFDVTISFLIVPENYVIKDVFPSDAVRSSLQQISQFYFSLIFYRIILNEQTVVHIRNTIGSKLKINPQNIDLRFNCTFVSLCHSFPYARFYFQSWYYVLFSSTHAGRRALGHAQCASRIRNQH
jgi:hypothetical protein